MDRGAWRTTVHVVAKNTTEQLTFSLDIILWTQIKLRLLKYHLDFKISNLTASYRDWDRHTEADSELPAHEI